MCKRSSTIISNLLFYLRKCSSPVSPPSYVEKEKEESVEEEQREEEGPYVNLQERV